MSGITPLIDTLLHQVLGKRADMPSTRELNAPVTPISPEDALQALKGDSRLEPKRQAPMEQPAAPKTSPPPVEISAKTAPQSSQVHFSASARAIAQAVANLTGNPLPDQPSLLKLSRPLMGTDQPLSSQALAQQLQASIRDSGLFFEAHLARWFRGELPRKQLEREPQMQRQESASKVLGGAALFMSDEPDGKLQGIVRHQLEMLAQPVLRWEGEAWSGLFMALTITPPAPEPRDNNTEEEKDTAQAEEDAFAWQSELSLTLQTLGRLDIKLRLDNQGVDLSLAADNTEVASRLLANQAALRSRLQDSGISEVSLRIFLRASAIEQPTPDLSSPEESQR